MATKSGDGGRIGDDSDFCELTGWAAHDTGPDSRGRSVTVQFSLPTSKMHEVEVGSGYDCDFTNRGVSQYKGTFLIKRKVSGQSQAVQVTAVNQGRIEVA